MDYRGNAAATAPVPFGPQEAGEEIGTGPGLLAQKFEQGRLRRARAGLEHGDDGLGHGREHRAHQVLVTVGHRGGRDERHPQPVGGPAHGRRRLGRAGGRDRGQTVLPQYVPQHAVERAVAVEPHPRLPVQFAQLDPVRGELPVSGAHHHDELLVAEVVGVGGAPLARRHQGEPQQAPAAQPLQLGGARLLEDGDLQPREAATQRAERSRQLPGTEAHLDGDHQLAHQLVGAGPRRRPRPPCRAHRGLGLPEERAADHGGHQPGRRTGEQLHAQLPLQSADLLGHRWLSDVQQLRGRRHRALLGNGQGVLELTKAHRLRLPRRNRCSSKQLGAATKDS